MHARAAAPATAAAAALITQALRLNGRLTATSMLCDRLMCLARMVRVVRWRAPAATRCRPLAAPTCPPRPRPTHSATGRCRSCWSSRSKTMKVCGVVWRACVVCVCVLAWVVVRHARRRGHHPCCRARCQRILLPHPPPNTPTHTHTATPNDATGWSPERAKAFGAVHVSALLKTVPVLLRERGTKDEDA
jgi:hypothetical protein